MTSIYWLDKIIMTAVELFKSLADDTRLSSILLIAKEQELCVCELVAALEVSQPKISRHLAQLRKSGLLTDTKRAQWVYYQINPQLPRWIKQIIDTTVESNQELIKEAELKLANMGDRPERQAICC